MSDANNSDFFVLVVPLVRPSGSQVWPSLAPTARGRWKFEVSPAWLTASSEYRVKFIRHFIDRPVRIVIAIGIIHVLMLAYGGWIHGPGWDEVGHLSAGISHWKTGKFDLYRVNPPLIRLVATLPVSLASIDLTWVWNSGDPISRPEWRLGQELWSLYGMDAYQFLTWSRWISLAWTFLAIVVLYRWGRELYGEWGGVLAVFLWCISPLVLSNAQMITPDTGASACGLLAGYSFWHWLGNTRHTWSESSLLGLVLGLAQLTKFTWLILFGLWPLLALLYRQPRSEAVPTPGIHSLRHLFLIVFPVAVLVINLGYGFENTFKPLGEFRFASQLFTGATGSSRQPQDVSDNRFERTALGVVPVPIPENFLRGVDRQKYDFEQGFSSYMRGRWKPRGWWYYYLYCLAVKAPVGMLVLFGMTVAISVYRATRGNTEVNTEDSDATLRENESCVATTAKSRKATSGAEFVFLDQVILLSPAVVIFLLVSSQTGFSHHFRYVMPAAPFVFIWMGKLASPTIWTMAGRIYRFPVIGFACWAATSSLWIFPHSHAYFNEFAGGPRSGHFHLLDSNIDWGQDILLLADWIDRHPDIQLKGVAYSLDHLIDRESLGIPRGRPPTREQLLRDDADSTFGWYAVFVRPLREKRGDYAYFLRLEPEEVLGHTVYLYHLEQSDIPRISK